MRKIYDTISGSKTNTFLFMTGLLVLGYVVGFVMIKANIL